MRHETIERYLLAISEIEDACGKVRTNAIAERLAVAPSTVSEICRKLSRCGYLSWRPYGEISITASGMEVVRRVRQRYKTALSLLKVLGVEADRAREEARRLEHAMSDEIIERIESLIGERPLVLGEEDV